MVVIRYDDNNHTARGGSGKSTLELFLIVSGQPHYRASCLKAIYDQQLCY